jgi:DNA-binding transcriptional LysR family regulator
VRLDQLKLFRDIAHARSVSRGAQANGISQSAASQHLQEAERVLGAQLVDRSKRPLDLTDTGRLYYEFCRDVLRREQEFHEALAQLKGRLEGAVRVAAIYSVGIRDIARLEKGLAARLPQAELTVEYLRPEKVYEAVRNGQADLGIVSYPESTREIVAIPWREEKMILAASPSHPLAAKKTVSVADLAGADYVAFDSDLRVGREVERYLRRNGVQINVVMHFDNIPSMKEAVALGQGVSILPIRVLETDIEEGRLAAIPIKGCTLARPLGVLHLRRKKLNAAAQAFLDLLREEASAERRDGRPGRA